MAMTIQVGQPVAQAIAKSFAFFKGNLPEGFDAGTALCVS